MFGSPSYSVPGRIFFLAVRVRRLESLCIVLFLFRLALPFSFLWSRVLLAWQTEDGQLASTTGWKGWLGYCMVFRL